MLLAEKPHMLSAEMLFPLSLFIGHIWFKLILLSFCS